MPRQNNKRQTKQKFYSKLPSDKNMTPLKERHFLNSHLVSLPRINSEQHKGSRKYSSCSSKQRMVMSFATNKDTHSKGKKENLINFDKFQEISKLLSSKNSIKDIHNAGASSSCLSVHDRTIVKPCFVKLERISVPAKQCIDFSDIKIYHSNKYINSKSKSSSSDCLLQEQLPQHNNTVVSCNSNKIQDKSSEIEILKPCSVILSRFVSDNKKCVSDMNQPVFCSNNCEMSELMDAEVSMSESFISTRLLSTSSSSAESEINRKTAELDKLVYPETSSVSDVNKKISDTNDNPLTSTPLKPRLTFDSDVEFSANKKMRTLDCNQSSIKKHDILSCDTHTSQKFDADESDDIFQSDIISLKKRTKVISSSSSSQKFDADESDDVFQSDIISPKKRTKVISSSSSSECSTVRNTQKYSVRNRRAYFQRGRKRRRIIPSERGYSHFASIAGSSSDSDSTVFNNCLATINSRKQGLKKRNIGSAGTPSALCNETTVNENSKKLNFMQSRNSLDRIDATNKNSFGYKSESSSNSETEGNISDNNLNKSSNNAYARKSKLRHSKCFFRRRRHLVINGTHSSSKDKNELKSPEEKITSSFSYNESSNAKREQKCDVIVNYNIKPCYVAVRRIDNPGVVTRIGEKFNNLYQDDFPKHTSQEDCFELNCNEQINSSRRTNRYKMYKSKKNGEHGSLSENNDFISVEKCRTLMVSDQLSKSRKHCFEKCTDYASVKSSVNELQHSSSNESSHQVSSNKQRRKSVHYFSDDSDSLPSDIIHYTLKKSSDRKFDSGSDNCIIKNCNRNLNNRETDVINDEEETHVAIGIEIASSQSCSSANREGDNSTERVNFYGPDCDDAYFADTDENTDLDIHTTENYSIVSQDNCKTSAGLEVNLSGIKYEDKNIPKKIPYCCLGSKNKIGKNSDSIFLFKSKTNGNVYIVDVFEFENIKKLFVTIQFKESAHFHCNDHHDENNLLTVSERIKALGCFEKEDARIYQKHPFIFGRNQLEAGDKNSEEKNFSLGGSNHVVGNDDVLSAEKDCSESSDDAGSEPRPSCSQTSQFEDLTMSSTSDSSDTTHHDKYDSLCVHCYEKFSSRIECYSHTCKGKLQEGFLCIYCEMIFTSYLRFRYHKRLHFT